MGVDKFPSGQGIKAAAPCPISVCCCVPRRKGGRPHAVEGLIRLFPRLWYAHSPTNGIPLMDYLVMLLLQIWFPLRLVGLRRGFVAVR